jgi:hypothetical protein
MIPQLMADAHAKPKSGLRLRAEVVTFGVLWAVPYAESRGLPRGHLFPDHYDMLAKCGARMDDFTRAITPDAGGT